MGEKILRIEQASWPRPEYKWSSYDGYFIITDQQTIKLGIDNGQNCCENWGYFMSQDNFDEFIGAEVLSVEIADEALNVEKMKEIDLYEGACMFVNINTSKGLLQFTAYNEHNGYYSHEAAVVSRQLTDTQYL